MKFNMLEYKKMLSDSDISVIYSGPIWASGIDGLADMMLKRLEFDEVSTSASQSVFSVFIEQINNMMMYSAEKDSKSDTEGNAVEVSKGIFILGVQKDSYFIQTGNLVSNYSAEILKERIDYLNTLDKQELRQYQRERMKADNDNLESKGAGLGLIVVARRATSPIEYEFEPYDDQRQYFTMYISIGQGDK